MNIELGESKTLNENIESIYQKSIDNEFNEYGYIDEIKTIVDYFKSQLNDENNKIEIFPMYFIKKENKSDNYLKQIMYILEQLGFECADVGNLIKVSLNHEIRNKLLVERVKSQLFDEKKKSNGMMVDKYMNFKLSNEWFIRELNRIEKDIYEKVSMGETSFVYEYDTEQFDSDCSSDFEILANSLVKLGYIVDINYDYDNPKIYISIDLNHVIEKTSDELVRRYKGTKNE